MLSIKEILKKLCAVSSPSGFEGEASELICALAEAEGLECKKDAMGNLIVHRGGTGKKCLLAAHMDTTGLLATFIDENGFVRFDAIGGLSVEQLHNIPVKFLNGVSGTVSYEEKVKRSERKMTSMFIDIGASDEKSAKEKVLPGDAAVFDGALRELSGGKICAPYLDNRIGVCIALWAMCNLRDCEYDVYAAFTVQEEVGCRGAKTAAFETDADFSIVLDVTDSCDTPGFSGYGETKIGCGVAIKVMDRAFIAHPDIVSALSETAEKENIPYCKDVITVGGTDGGSIHLTKNGIPTGGISVPVRYMHSPCEVADMSDIEKSASLLLKTLETNAIIL